VVTVEFSVDPAQMPSGSLVPSIVTPSAMTTACPANSIPSMNIATRSTASSLRETNAVSLSVVASMSAREALLLLVPRASTDSSIGSRLRS
jgi:hypothetical protein